MAGSKWIEYCQDGSRRHGYQSFRRGVRASGYFLTNSTKDTRYNVWCDMAEQLLESHRNRLSLEKRFTHEDVNWCCRVAPDPGLTAGAKLRRLLAGPPVCRSGTGRGAASRTGNRTDTSTGSNRSREAEPPALSLLPASNRRPFGERRYAERAKDNNNKASGRQAPEINCPLSRCGIL